MVQLKILFNIFEIQLIFYIKNKNILRSNQRRPHAHNPSSISGTKTHEWREEVEIEIEHN